jgi:hypothetical protein
MNDHQKIPVVQHENDDIAIINQVRSGRSFESALNGSEFSFAVENGCGSCADLDSVRNWIHFLSGSRYIRSNYRYFERHIKRYQYFLSFLVT